MSKKDGEFEAVTVRHIRVQRIERRGKQTGEVMHKKITEKLARKTAKEGTTGAAIGE